MTDDSEPVTPYSGTLPLVMGLAMVAGFLDAVSLSRITHTFVAFQTGNLVLVGLGIGRGDWSDAAPPAVAIVAFVLGSALVPMVLRTADRARESVVRQLLGTAAGLLLLEVVVVGIVTGLGESADAPGRALRYVCTVLSGLAMAFQTPVVRSVDGVAVSSTFSSGMLTRFGQAAGARWNPAHRAHESVVLRVLGATVLAFLTGAAVGGALLEPLGNATLVIPVVVLSVIATGARRITSA